MRPRAASLFEGPAHCFRWRDRVEPTPPGWVAKDAPALAKLRELAATYPRYGYRFMNVFWAPAGFRMGVDRLYRLWRQAGL